MTHLATAKRLSFFSSMVSVVARFSGQPDNTCENIDHLHVFGSELVGQIMLHIFNKKMVDSIELIVHFYIIICIIYPYLEECQL